MSYYFFSQIKIDNTFIKFIIRLTIQLTFGIYLIDIWIMDKFLKKKITNLIKENYLIKNLIIIIYTLEKVLLTLLFDLILFYIFKFLKISILLKKLLQIFDNIIE